MNKCEKEGKFVEAEIAKQRIEQLKTVEDKQMYDEVKKRHAEERAALENSQKQELNEFNLKMDQELYSLSNKCQELQKEMNERHEEEIGDIAENFGNSEKKPVANPSSDLIEKNKQLELYVKKKE